MQLKSRSTQGALASNKRAGNWADAKARQMRLRFARKYWRQLLLMSLVVVLPPLLVLPFVDGQFLRGVVFGITLGAAITGAVSWIAVASGSASVTFGAWAERWTSESLQVMRKHGYELINRARLGYGDLDHVLIGPAGVFVIETKWSATKLGPGVRPLRGQGACSAQSDQPAA